TQHRQQPRIVPRLLDVVARAAPHRLDRTLDRAPRRHYHDRQRRVQLLEARQQLEAFAPRRGVARIVQVDQQRIEVALLYRLQYTRRRCGRLHLVVLRLQQDAERLEDIGLVVGDQ